MKLKYSLNNKGEVDGCGYNKAFEFEVNENTPFRTIGEHMNWKLVNGIWEWYDYTWEFEEYPVKVIISETDILDTDDYIALHGHVKGLINSGNAKMSTINNKREMYFERLLPAHENMLKGDNRVIIKRK